MLTRIFFTIKVEEDGRIVQSSTLVEDTGDSQDAYQACAVYIFETFGLVEVLAMSDSEEAIA